MLTPWAVLYVILRILPFVHFRFTSFIYLFISDLPKEVFMHHFWRLRNVHNHILTHALLLIKLNFPEIFAQQQEVYLIDQLFASVKDIWQYFSLSILLISPF